MLQFAALIVGAHVNEMILYQVVVQFLVLQEKSGNEPKQAAVCEQRNACKK